MLIDVVRVTPRADFTLDLEYANGERRVFDATPLLSIKPWTALSNWATFRLARVEYGVVTWPGDLDIAPETLYDRSRPIVVDRARSALQQQPALP
jgi:hypothetical protein